MVKPGDIVRFLNAVGGGRVSRVDGNIAYVEDEDGFETPVMTRECVIVADAASQVAGIAAQEARQQQSAQPRRDAPRQNQASVNDKVAEQALTDADIAETEGGDILNVVLAFEPQDIRQISTTTFDAYLVNDSNYYISFICMTRRTGEADSWTTRYAGVIEPNIQLYLGTVTRDMLVDMDYIAMQMVAYKQGRTFARKPAMTVEYRMDTTKFCKLHCFGDSVYFDTPVMALDIVRDDKPYTPVRVNPGELRQAMQQKLAADRRPGERRKVVKRGQRKPGTIVVDLHINELVDNTRGLSNSDMLNLQIDEFRRVMDANLRNHGQKIVFIHGKGEGVLRQAILKELAHRYKGHDAQDASFREYGFGATQVTIR